MEGLGPLSKFPCRLYISTPVGHPLDVATKMLSDALAANDVAAVLYTPSGKDAAEHASILMQCAISHEAAFIVADDIAFAREIGADGLYISGNVEAYSKARSELGDDRIIGISTALNRHDAMCLGEVGANYICFDPHASPSSPQNSEHSLESLIKWWCELFEVPCLAPAYAEVEKNRALIAAGVDFLSFGSSLWSSPENATKTLQSISHLIAECGREQ